jgi:release factor glutamine methyltransferase
MLETPDYSHFSTSDYEKIYEPCEDTFLFLDALEADIAFLNELRPAFVVEIGSGSGLVINFLAKHLRNSNETAFFATDLNPTACLATQRTCLKNRNHNINILNCDLVTPLQDRLHGKIDVLLFNPPYVVTEAGELGSHGIQAAWAGGVDGREVMNRLFPLIDNLLSPNGAFYLVCIKQNNIEQIGELFSKLGFSMKIVLNRKAGIEHLFVLKICRK